jgi:hypothetical protein
MDQLLEDLGGRNDWGIDGWDAGKLDQSLKGVGSGSLMVPLLILFNVNSRVAAATSGFSKLFISAATVVLALVGKSYHSLQRESSHWQIWASSSDSLFLED